MSGNELIKFEDIQSRIYTIHSVQVMLDEDLAKFYSVETRVLNQAVKRNIDRFPESFMFQLAEDETDDLISQSVISSSGHGGRRKLPYVFTEQGVAMLAGVLRSDTAIKMSIQIINAFVAMRRFIATNAHIFQRLDTLEIKQIDTDKKIDAVLNAIENKQIQPKQGIFFDGQIFDAYKFVADLIRTAQRSITIIDNYIDDTVLTHITKINADVKVTIFTRSISKQLALDVKKFNAQYPPIAIKEFKNSHDRFIIIDDKTVYHFGASLKDLGNKWFAFSKMDIGAIEMLTRLDGMKA
ncbi:MAG TPA: ORF6N domain-containing protein [Methanosarcinaceae archaeon]|nr:ORF6N domain-containing protein [Methanosarcinaceae archaeon]